jgi:hypothetical protein
VFDWYSVIYVFIYVRFNDLASVSGYVALNSTMSKMNWNEGERKRSWFNLRHCHGTCFEVWGKHVTSQPLIFWSRPKFNQAHSERSSETQHIGTFCSVLQIKTATKDSSLLGCYTLSFGSYRCNGLAFHQHLCEVFRSTMEGPLSNTVCEPPCYSDCQLLWHLNILGEVRIFTFLCFVDRVSLYNLL